MGPSCTKNPLRSCLNFRLDLRSTFGGSWARFRSHVGGILGSNLALKSVSNLKRSKCTKLYYLQYETMFFYRPRGSEIEEKSMPQRLQAQSAFQEAKNHEKVSNIGPSWAPKPSQVASQIARKRSSTGQMVTTRGPSNPGR